MNIWKRLDAVMHIMNFATHREPLTPYEITEIIMREQANFGDKLRNSHAYKEIQRLKKEKAEIPKELVSSFLKQIPNPDNIHKSIKKREAQLYYESINPGGSLYFERANYVILFLIALLGGYYFAANFEFLSWLPYLSPLKVILIITCIVLEIFFTGAFVLSTRYHKKAREKGEFELAHDIKQEVGVSKKFVIAFCIFAVIQLAMFQPLIMKHERIARNMTLYKIYPESYDHNAKVSKLEHDSDNFGDMSYVLYEMGGVEIATIWTAPFNKLISYLIFTLILLFMLTSLKWGDHELMGISYVFFAIGLVFLNLYPDRILGFAPETTAFFIAGAYLLGAWYYYYKIISPIGEPITYTKPVITEKAKPLVGGTLSEITGGTFGGGGYLNSQTKAREYDDRAQKERDRQEADALHNNSTLRKQGGMNEKTKKLDDERRLNDEKPNPWDGKK